MDFIVKFYEISLYRILKSLTFALTFVNSGQSEGFQPMRIVFKLKTTNLLPWVNCYDYCFRLKNRRNWQSNLGPNAGSIQTFLINRPFSSVYVVHSCVFSVLHFTLKLLIDRDPCTDLCKSHYLLPQVLEFMSPNLK